jgi:outer membrane protein TolC
LARENAQTTAQNAGHDEETQFRAIRDSLAKIENRRNVVQASQRAYELTDASYKSGAGRYLDERLNLMSLLYDLEAKYDGGR